MNATVETLLGALHDDPGDTTTWLALADALEEDGQAERAELTRLSCRLRCLPFEEGQAEQQRVLELLQSGVPPCVPELVNSIGMRFALIPAGRFLMGSPDDQRGRKKHEGPQHEVEITRAFYLGVHPVTQEQYTTVMGRNPSCFSSTGEGKDKVTALDTKDFPVERVSWRKADIFLKTLVARPEEQERGLKYRLPTEAEWEYACRGGLPCYSVFHFGGSLSSRQANFSGLHPCGGAEQGPYLGRTCSVGSYPPNAFGLHDLHGNVWEWCADRYDAHFYGKSPGKDPSGPARGSNRVLRGGGWLNNANSCTATYRHGFDPGGYHNYLGFRVLAVPSGKQGQTAPGERGVAGRGEAPEKAPPARD